MIQFTLPVWLIVTVAISQYSAAYEAPYVEKAPHIDGVVDDLLWDKAHWHAIDHHILGAVPDAEDFQGRFKIVWTKSHLYILAEIVDDVLFDRYADPLDRYWADDSLEIFIDEDKSGGNHLNNHNAFAYHIALDNQVVDIGPTPNGEIKPQLFNHHATSVWKRSPQPPHKVIWEVALVVYNDQLAPVKLTAGKHIGFMLAYCDNDGSAGREHFYGSHAITPVNGDKNRGYIDASVFGTLTLIR